MRYLNLVRNIANWELYLGIKFGLIQPDPIHFITRSGVRIEVPRRLLQTFKEVFMDECYMEMARPLQPGATVLDIGANAGFFTMFAAARFPQPKIYSFEPIPANFKQLEINRRLNPNANITLHQAAVSGAPGEVKLTYDPADSFTTSASIVRSEKGEEIRVRGYSLEEIFDTYQIRQCDFLKMDCEGAEFEILYQCPNAVLERVSQMVMEVHPSSTPGHSMQAMDGFLNQNGFTTRQLPVDMLWAWRS